MRYTEFGTHATEEAPKWKRLLDAALLMATGKSIVTDNPSVNVVPLPDGRLLALSGEWEGRGRWEGRGGERGANGEWDNGREWTLERGVEWGGKVQWVGRGGEWKRQRAIQGRGGGGKESLDGGGRVGWGEGTKEAGG